MDADFSTHRAKSGAERFAARAAYADYEGNAAFEERNRAILGCLSATSVSWLDAGCGPGHAGRALAAAGRQVSSLDLSRAALRMGPPRPICGGIDALPFGDRSFDGVLCLEVLEHLPEQVFRRAVSELPRVARRQLVIGVPDRENLRRNAMRCARCGTRFNRSGHLRRFDEASTAALFPGFALRRVWRGGPRVRDYAGPLLWTRHHVAGRYSEMAGLEGNLCPTCGEDHFPPFRHNALSFALDGLNRLVSRRRSYWLVVFLEREDR